MPLTKGLRDEENERISNILKKLVSLVYVPDFYGYELDEILKELGLNQSSLLQFTSENLILHLEKLHFDWENTEQFADILMILAEKPENTKLKESAIVLYNYIQTESKTFSFEIFNKIASAKK